MNQPAIQELQLLLDFMSDDDEDDDRGKNIFKRVTLVKEKQQKFQVSLLNPK
jgi:hypothetical protein